LNRPQSEMNMSHVETNFLIRLSYSIQFFSSDVTLFYKMQSFVYSILQSML